MCVSAVFLVCLLCGHDVFVGTDVCTYAIWDNGVTAAYLYAAFRPSVDCRWSAVSTFPLCMQPVLSVSRFFSEGCAG